MTPTASAAAPTESSTPASASTTARSWAPIVLPVAVFALAAFAWLYEGRGVTFFIDEWQWIIGRHSPNEASLLQPFHNHLMAVPIAIHQALYRLVGIGSQVPYRVVLLGVHLTCSWLVFTYVRRRIPWQLALAAASVLAFYGYTWTITLWPISLGWAIATAAAVGALLLLDRDARRADAGAAALLVIGIASTSVAVAFVVGIAAEIVLKREWRRIWVVVVPVAVYGAWFLGYGSGTTEPGSLGAVVRFIEKLLAQTTGTLLGVQARGTWAHVTLGVVGAALAVTWYTLGRRTSPRVAGLVVALGSYTVLLALARATSGVTTWYSYPAAVLLLLLVGELLAGRLAASWLTFAVIVVAVWAIAWNLGEMRDAGDFLRGISQKGAGRAGRHRPRARPCRSLVQAGELLPPRRDCPRVLRCRGSVRVTGVLHRGAAPFTPRGPARGRRSARAGSEDHAAYRWDTASGGWVRELARLTLEGADEGRHPLRAGSDERVDRDVRRRGAASPFDR